MAERRMFAKTIIDSDAFLDMPLSTQALYFHLSMRADDEGFINNPRKIQRMVGASDDDLKLLMMKSFIITFDSGVVVIKHWRIHNYIQRDRFKATMYTEEKSMLALKDNNAYTLEKKSDTKCIQDVHNLDTEENDDFETENVESRINTDEENDCVQCIHDVYKMDTQDRLGKDRLGKDRLGKDRLGKREVVDYQQIANMYNDTCVSFPRLTTLSDARKKAIKARLKTYTIDDFARLFNMAEQSDFLKGANNRNWSANFDWLIKDSNMAKVLDGNYTNKGNATTPKTNNNLEDSYAMMAAWAQK